MSDSTTPDDEVPPPPATPQMPPPPTVPQGHRGPGGYGAPGGYGGYVSPSTAIPAPPVPVRRRSTAGGAALLALVVVVPLLIAAGIFWATSGNDEQTPGDALTDWVDAVYDQDSDDVCDGMATSNHARFQEEGLSCEEAMDELFGLLEEQGADFGGNGSVSFGPFDFGSGIGSPDVEVVSEEIDGDRAELTVRVEGEDIDPDGPIVLVKEDGIWKVDLLTGLDEDSESTACETEERTVRTAAEAYYAQFGTYPADMQALVDEDFLRKLSTRVELGPDGTVSPIGDCA